MERTTGSSLPGILKVDLEKTLNPKPCIQGPCSSQVGFWDSILFFFGFRVLVWGQSKQVKQCRIPDMLDSF